MLIIGIILFISAIVILVMGMNKIFPSYLDAIMVFVFIGSLSIGASFIVVGAVNDLIVAGAVNAPSPVASHSCK